MNSEWWTLPEAAQNIPDYSYRQLKRLCDCEIIPTLVRDGEKRRRVRPWILRAHRDGVNVRKVAKDITQEAFEKLLPTLRKG